MTKIPFAVIDENLRVTPLGYVADYCTFCHEIRQFGLAEYQWCASLNALDSYTVTPEFKVHCAACNLTFASHPDRYAKVLAEPAADLAFAVQVTYPTLREDFADEVAQETLCRQANASCVERQLRLRDTLKTVAGFSPRSIAAGIPQHLFHSLSRGALIALLTFWAMHLFLLKRADALPAAFLAGMFCAVIVFFWLRSKHESTRDKVSSECLHQLAVSFAPLNPTEAELDAQLTRLRRENLEFAGRLTAQKILSAIRQVPSEPPMPRVGVAREYSQTRSMSQPI